jgi:hypothetical protein
MKTDDFTGDLTSNGQITVPLEIAAWRAAGRRQFDAAYTANDSVYEQLVDDASAR